MAVSKKKNKQSKKVPQKTSKRTTKKINKKKDINIREELSRRHPRNYMRDEVWNFILAGISFFIAVFFVGSVTGHGGPVGEYSYDQLTKLLGWGYWLLPGLLLVLAYSFIQEIERDFHPMKILGSILFLLSGLGVIELIFTQGGWIGSILSGLQNPIGYPMALLLMIILFIISMALILDTVPFISRLWSDEADDEDEEYGDERVGVLSPEESELIREAARARAFGEYEKTGQMPAQTAEATYPHTSGQDTAEEKSGKSANTIEDTINQKIRQTFSRKDAGKSQNTGYLPDNTALPPTTLVSKDKGKPEVGDIKSNANIIKRTLANFNITVEMGEVEVGPTVTRYAFKPAEGVKLARIGGLKDDLALALAAKTIRMETPIPGKSLVGIEIPNRTSTMVGFGTLIEHPNFHSSGYKLPLGIGKDIAGEARFIDLARAPHMLIAGATGSGKSVTVHALVNSLLYTYGPDMLKFIMVDPKRVELTLYNGIPHLLTPVITDAKSAILALKWAVKEMNRRYDVLQEHSVRDVASYHKNILYPAQERAQSDEEIEVPERMPYIVVIIDELADIMQAYPRELEAGIVQLAQMSRAVGIHLILSTQRPSVNIITGLIKANVPTRLALQVASNIDSRTILDAGGAEQLLGKGDMLFMTGDMSKPVRVQSPNITEEEVKKVVGWLKKYYRGDVPDEIDLSLKAVADSNIMFAGSIGADEDEDDLYEDAKASVIEAGKASTSYIQRRLRVGYSRAARLIDMLEERGVVGPARGSSPREIIEKPEDEEAIETASLEAEQVDNTEDGNRRDTA
ncbi:MAG: DNA translocase FtsK [Patescibacteria group bacterium]